MVPSPKDLILVILCSKLKGSDGEPVMVGFLLRSLNKGIISHLFVLARLWLVYWRLCRFKHSFWGRVAVFITMFFAHLKHRIIFDELHIILVILFAVFDHAS